MPLYYDPTKTAGNNDGSAPDHAFTTMQRAMDFAHGMGGPTPPYSWVPTPAGATASGVGNRGYRPGITIQMQPVTVAQQERCAEPVYLDGHGQQAPIYVVGDPTSREGALARNIYADNKFQGFAPFAGGELILDGFTIRGKKDCTLVNPLQGGIATARNLYLGPGDDGFNSCFGAPAHAILNFNGPNTFIGGGFYVLFCTIEGGMLNFAPDAEFRFDNAMYVNTVFSLQHADSWTQGVPIKWRGRDGAMSVPAITWPYEGGPTRKARVFNGSVLSLSGALASVPGAFADQDSSWIL